MSANFWRETVNYWNGCKGMYKQVKNLEGQISIPSPKIFFFFYWLALHIKDQDISTL